MRFIVEFTAGSELCEEEIYEVLAASIITTSDGLIDLQSIQVQRMAEEVEPEARSEARSEHSPGDAEMNPEDGSMRRSPDEEGLTAEGARAEAAEDYK